MKWQQRQAENPEGFTFCLESSSKCLNNNQKN